MKFDKNFWKHWAGDWRSYLAEFLGTFLFVLLAASAVVVNFLYGQLGLLGISFIIGFSYMALVFGTVHLSGGFLNPAVTFALWVGQKLTTTKTFFLLTSQIVASICAYALITVLFGREAMQVSLGAPQLGLGVMPQNAILWEAIITALVVFVVFSTMVDRRGPVSFGPLVLGFVVFCGTLLLFQITGAGLNPARAIGASVVMGEYNSLAIWVLGPLAGSLFGAVYETIFVKKTHKK